MSNNKKIVFSDITKYSSEIINENPNVAKVLKSTIKNTVEKALSDETFSFDGVEGLTFEQAIDLAYGKSTRAEEYIANVIEFLGQPKYQDLMYTIQKVQFTQYSTCGGDKPSNFTSNTIVCWNFPSLVAGF